MILFNAHDEICEIREQLCETLKKSWQGKQCEPKTDGSDDLKLFQTAECVGELMRDPDAGVKAKSDRVFRVRERCREYAKNGDGEDVTRRFRRNRSRNGGGFLGTVRISEREYEISADGNYRCREVSLRISVLFLQLIAAEQATIIQEMGGIVGHER